MNVKTLALAAAAAAAATSAQAADLPMAAEPVNYVQACDAFGAGYFQLPGSATCVKLGGRIRAQYVSHDFNQDLGVVTDATDAEYAAVADGSALSASDYADLVKDVADKKKAFNEAAADGKEAAMLALVAAEGEVAKYTEVKAAEAEERNDYSAYTRGYLYFTSMTGTDFGTIKTFTELTATWDEEGNGTNGLGDAWVQIGTNYGSFLFGRESSVFDAFTGYTWIGPVGNSFSDESTLQASFTADLGNGVTAAISAEQASYRDGQDNGVDIVGALKLSQGWGSFQLSGAAHDKADEDGYGYAAGATAAINLDMLKEGTEITFQAQYADEAGKYIAAKDADVTGYALSGGIETALTEKVSAQLDVSYLALDKDSADYSKTSVNGSVVYSPVAGLGLALAAGWAQQDDNTAEKYDDETRVGARVQYTF